MTSVEIVPKVAVMTFRDLREQAGLTQTKLAAMAGLDSTTVSQIELGKLESPRYQTVEKLAIALNLTVQQIAAAIEASHKAAA